jgi:hypothetical protein
VHLVALTRLVFGKSGWSSVNDSTARRGWRSPSSTTSSGASRQSGLVALGTFPHAGPRLRPGRVDSRGCADDFAYRRFYELGEGFEPRALRVSPEDEMRRRARQQPHPPTELPTSALGLPELSDDLLTLNRDAGADLAANAARRSGSHRRAKAAHFGMPCVRYPDLVLRDPVFHVYLLSHGHAKGGT